MPRPVTIEDLKRAGIFRNEDTTVDDATISFLARSPKTQRRFFAKNERIFEQYAPNTKTILLLLEGIGHVRRFDNTGRVERHLAFRIPGEQMGLALALANTVYDATTHALTDLQVIEISCEDFLTAMQYSRPLIQNTVRSLSYRFHHYAFYLQNALAFANRDEIVENYKDRFSVLLLEAHQAIRANNLIGNKITKIPIKQDDIAEFLRIPREQLINTILPSFRDTGLMNRNVTLATLTDQQIAKLLERLEGRGIELYLHQKKLKSGGSAPKLYLQQGI